MKMNDLWFAITLFFIQLLAVTSPFRMWGLWFPGFMQEQFWNVRHPIFGAAIVSTKKRGDQKMENTTLLILGWKQGV
jgi:hypothetical protein